MITKRITWAQFKERVEELGMQDDMEIAWIDIRGWSINDISVYVKNGVAEIS